MCGIAGIAAKEPMCLGGLVEAMTESLAHRGPDDFGYIALDPGCGALGAAREIGREKQARMFLGHRRLSIIDIEGSRQPLCNEDGTVWAVFNGEIYNYRELREKLSLKGHMLREKGDTEVLVHLWEEYGEQMPGHLLGMFAFAIYDTSKDVLFIARDRYGQKPLYYMENSQVLAFASELQALWHVPDFPFRNIDMGAMSHYFRYGYIPSPATVFRGVHSLLSGTSMLWKNHQLSHSRYWKPSVRGEIENPDYERIQSLIDESVKNRLIADVPLGAFLSGGIDSSSVVASMSEHSAASVKTFTVSMGNNWFDESAEAELVADHLGTQHRTIKVEPDFIGAIEKLSMHYGQPFADHSAVPTYYISRETRRHVAVALTGDGGDELFAGYGSYTNKRLYSILGRIPQFLRPLLSVLSGGVGRRSDSTGHLQDSILSAGDIPWKGENVSPLFHSHWRKQGFTEEMLSADTAIGEEVYGCFKAYFDEAESEDPVEKWLEADQRMYLCDDILTKVDIASMSVSLECRAPFLDHRLAEYVNKIRICEKLEGNESKHILRKLLARRVPESISKLPKKGFSLPMGLWIRTGIRDWMHSLLFDNRDAWKPYLKEGFVEDIWKEHQNGKLDHQARLWEVAVLSMWHSDLKGLNISRAGKKA